MLARPRPPAQVRRASKGSPKLSISFPSSDDSHIPQLLSRADGIIRERERELGLTSEFSRELKQIHEALVAQTPSTSPSLFHAQLPASPQGHSRSISTFSNTSTPFQSLHALHSTQSPVQSDLAQPAVTRHTRRISITQSELARLSDQNAELLQKLEQLEEESALADKAGRRRLGKLEHEIQTLRDELDEARQDAASKTEERRSAPKIKKIKDQESQELESKSSPTFQDFAPSSSSLSRSSSSSSSYSADSSSTHSDSSNLILTHLLSKISELEEANVQICREQRDTAGRLRDAQSEVEGIRKVWSYLGMGPGLGNDEGDESFDVEIVDDDDQDINEMQGTIRFRSLKRDILASLASASHAANVSTSSTIAQMDSVNSLRSFALDFDEGISGEMHSTLRTPSKLNIQSSGRHRKTVVGLFGKEGDISSDFLNLDAVSSPSSAGALNAVLSPTDELSELDISLSLERSHSSKAAEIPPNELGLLSGRCPRTLQSEIGDFGDESFSHQRSRNNSLVKELEESFDSEGEGYLDDGDQDSCNRDDQETQKYQFGFPPASIRVTPPTPAPDFSSSAATSLPHAPEPLDSTPAQYMVNSKASSARIRRISLSQSVKARAGRWGPRLNDIFNHDQVGSGSAIEYRSSDGLGVKLGEGLSSVFGSDAVGKKARLKPKPSLSSQERSASHSSGLLSSRGAVHPPLLMDSCTAKSSTHSSLQNSSALSSSGSRALIHPSSPGVERVRSLVLEVWLWIQFVAVLSMFIWTVAKKGPRDVLRVGEEAEITPQGGNSGTLRDDEEPQS